MQEEQLTSHDKTEEANQEDRSAMDEQHEELYTQILERSTVAEET